MMLLPKHWHNCKESFQGPFKVPSIDSCIVNMQVWHADDYVAPNIKGWESPDEYSFRNIQHFCLVWMPHIESWGILELFFWKPSKLRVCKHLKFRIWIKYFSYSKHILFKKCIFRFSQIFGHDWICSWRGKYSDKFEYLNKRRLSLFYCNYREWFCAPLLPVRHAEATGQFLFHQALFAKSRHFLFIKTLRVKCVIEGMGYS